eukprot:3389619-Prymnesium_polylepis.1
MDNSVPLLTPTQWTILGASDTWSRTRLDTHPTPYRVYGPQSYAPPVPPRARPHHRSRSRLAP